MRNIVGSPARGNNFFRRDAEIRKIIDRIENGHNLQLIAPRRIGKTSILFHLLDQKVEGYAYVYLDTERIDNEEDFYKKIIKELCKVEEISISKRLFQRFREEARFLNRLKSIKILGNEIAFNEENLDLNYYEEIKNFLSGIELEENMQLVLLIDEFPQTVVNILEADHGETVNAIKFLQSNRELRQDPEVNRNVRFIYTGSIGLTQTVSNIQASAFINDINVVEIAPFNFEEGVEFLDRLSEPKGLKIPKEAALYLLKKIAWIIPFHIQLAMQEIISLSSNTRAIDQDLIDEAFTNIVEYRNRSHFEHYYSHLKKEFKGISFEFADKALKQIAKQGKLDRTVLYDMGTGFGIKENYRSIIDTLCYEGYINNNGNHQFYQFNSPIVRMWWQKHICE